VIAATLLRDGCSRLLVGDAIAPKQRLNQLGIVTRFKARKARLYLGPICKLNLVKIFTKTDRLSKRKDVALINILKRKIDDFVVRRHAFVSQF
jgi:hypothetical protein